MHHLEVVLGLAGDLLGLDPALGFVVKCFESHSLLGRVHWVERSCLTVLDGRDSGITSKAQMEQGEAGIAKLSLLLGEVRLGDGSIDQQTGEGGPCPSTPGPLCYLRTVFTFQTGLKVPLSQHQRICEEQFPCF